MVTYDPERDLTPQFLVTVSEWIRMSGEVFVLLRYLHAAGAKDVAFCRTPAVFDRLVAEAPIGTDIEVFRQPQLPLRGVVDDAFIASALALVPEGAEYLVATHATRNDTLLRAQWEMGDSHEGLAASLEELRGQEVAMGPCPDFSSPDNSDLISASKGGIDGAR